MILLLSLLFGALIGWFVASLLKSHPAGWTRHLGRRIGVPAGALVAFLLYRATEMNLRDPLLSSFKDVALREATLGVVQTIIQAFLALSLFEASCDYLITDGPLVDKRAQGLLIPLSRKIVRTALVVATAILVFAQLGKDVTGALAGLGIGGLVVALAAKDSVENIFGSFTVLFDMPFALGDWVKIDKVEGIIEEINLRSTRIRTFEDSVVTLPNSNLIKAAVENYGARRYRRQRFTVRLSYDSSQMAIRRFCESLREYLQEKKEVHEDRLVVQFYEMSEQSLGVLVQCFLQAENFQEEAKYRGEILENILILAERTGVVFAEKKLDFGGAPEN